MMGLNGWELTILQWIQENGRTPFLDKVLPVITSLADDGICWIVLAVVLLCIPRTRRAGLSMGLALLLGLLVGNILLKNIVGRIRPYDVDPSVLLLIERLSDFSFPSGHTLASVGASVALTVRHRWAGIAALVLSAVIAFSRLYLFVHYPTDVLAGAVLGVGTGLCGCLLADKILAALQKRKEQKQAAP